jgi:L-alanine-DL-glutamate epimerase-like enolase superfamily enzyme
MSGSGIAVAHGVVESVLLTAYDIPTSTEGVELAESDGTARWSSTGMLIVELEAGCETGLGYAYTSRAALAVARDQLAPLVLGGDPLQTGRHFWAMAESVRNLGWPGVCASAVSAMDVALNDLAARRLGIPLATLVGGARDRVMAYGSGGFTSYTEAHLERQLGGWVAEGLRAVKMKVGRDPSADPARVAAARRAIGDDVALVVDANGAYSCKQALGLAEVFAESGVSWFEEPVSSDDLDGLRMLCERAPAGMQIAAGEYGYTPAAFHRLLAAGAVDTLQADATRCGGVTGFVLAHAQAQAGGIPLSAHTAPALHASIASGLRDVVNVEYFHDHAIIEQRFFDGVPTLEAGDLVPDLARPGHGLTLKRTDAAPYLTNGARLSRDAAA